MKSSHHRTRARRIYAWTFAVFALCQLTGSLLLDNVWPLVRFDDGRNMLRRFQSLHDSGRSPDVIVLGTSRFLNIREDALTGSLRLATGDSCLNAFNASVAAGDPETAAFLLDHLLAACAKPRLLVLEVSPELLNQHSGWINFQIYRLLRWQDLPRSSGQIVHSGNVAKLAEARLLPLIVFRKKIGDSLLQTWSEWQNGPPSPPLEQFPELIDWRAHFSVPETVDDDFPKVAASSEKFYRHKLREYKVGGPALDALLHILDRCRENKISILLLSAPVTSFHRAFYSSDVKEKYYAFLKQLEQSRGIEFAECHDSVPDPLFTDSNHTNPDGGIYFAEKLGREILGPRLRSNLVVGQPVSRSSGGREIRSSQ